MSEGERNYRWSQDIVEELVRLGIRRFCLCPGSRCTPLTVAVARHPSAEIVRHVDERGTGFYAVGHARATGTPAVIVCTSGTATANLLPAVVEASLDRLPLLLLTADRPPELRDAQANQAIDQVKLYGGYVRWQFDLPCPTEAIDPGMVLTTIDQAVARASGYPPGPVQVNCQFRQPFLTDALPESSTGSRSGGGPPYTRQYRPTQVAAPSIIEAAVDRLRQAERGLLLVGHLRRDEARAAVTELARHLQWPVAADVGSGLRLGRPDACFLSHYDLLLAAETAASASLRTPDCVLQIGGRLVSKRLEALVAGLAPGALVRLQDHPERDDPHHRGGIVVEGDLATSCQALQNRLATGRADDRLRALQQMDAKVSQGWADGAFSEPAIVRTIVRDLPADHALFLGASLPVRDVNTFADADGPGRAIGTNRGASGIDGTIASAVGFAEGLGRATALILGDLSALHDLNSLALVGSRRTPLTIFLINNDGGGIFSLLPIAEQQELFEANFLTPHGYRFAAAAAMFGIPYEAPADQAKLQDVLRARQHVTGPMLVEIHTGRDDFRAEMRRLLALLA